MSTVQVGSAQTSRHLKARRCRLTDTVKLLARFNSPLKKKQAAGKLLTPVPDIIDSDHESYAAHVSSQPTSFVVVASAIKWTFDIIAKKERVETAQKIQPS